MTKKLLIIIKKYRFEILLACGIVTLYFTTRLLNLLILPIFADEAIYVRWAQVMRSEPSLRFLPLSDGKTPLFMWTLMLLLKFFSDPLFAGRLLSVLSGFGTLIGIWVLANYLFGRRVAYISAFLYAIVPYMFFFDRMALVDSYLNFWGVWSLFLSVLLVKTLRLDVAMILGMVIAGGVLTKPTGWFFLLNLPLSLLLFSFKKPYWGKLGQLFALWLVSFFFVALGYNILRLGENFHLIALRNRDYTFTISEALGHPFDPFLTHLRYIWQWFGGFLTWPIFFAIFVGGVLSLWQRNLKGLVILLWAVTPLLVQAEIAKVFTARYLIFSATPLLILSAVSINYVLGKLEAKYGRASIVLVLVLISTLPAYFIGSFLIDPEKAPLPRSERIGYLEEWTAGQGIPEVASYIRNRAKDGRQIVVGSEGSFGTPFNGLEIYLGDLANVRVFGRGGGGFDKVIGSLISSSKDQETYFVTNESRKDFEDSRLKLIAKYPKAQGPKGREHLLFYQVLP